MGEVETLPGDLGPLPRARCDGARVWIVDWARVAARWPAWPTDLNPAERERMRRIVREEDQLRFGVTRAMLRVVLGRALDCHPGDVALATSRHGRPRLGGGRAAMPWCFSVSHSGDFAMIGVARGRPIGVDVEQMRPGATLAEIAPSICGEAELAEAERLPVGEGPLDLYRRWTIKEAYIKAIGLGLSFDPKRVGVSRRLPSAATPQYGLDARGRWTLVLPDLAPDHLGAVLVFGSATRVAVARFEACG